MDNGEEKPETEFADDSSKKCRQDLLRLRAEFSNWQKDEAKRFSEFALYARETILKELLPVRDLLLRALAHIPAPDLSNNWVSGISAIEKRFAEILSKLGVKEIPARGQYFDPKYHEIVESVEGEEYMIFEEIEKGYQWEDGRIIRPAKVKVGKS